MIYVISDIHGMYDEFERMLKLINFKPSDTLYVIGDTIDRGPEPIKVLKRVIETSNMIFIRGNHEDMMLSTLQEPMFFKKNFMLWKHNGGQITHDQYKELSKKEQEEIEKVLTGLPYFKMITVNDKRFLLVHGGLYIGFEEDYSNRFVSGPDLVWERPTEIMIKSGRGYIGIEDICDYVMCGHTPTFMYGEEYEGKIIKSGNIIMTDCGAVFKDYSGRLGCIRLDDMKEFYV